MLNSKIFINSAISFCAISAVAMSRKILYQQELNLPIVEEDNTDITSFFSTIYWLQVTTVCSFLTAVGISAAHVLLETNGKNPPALLTSIHAKSMTALYFLTPLVFTMCSSWESSKAVVNKLPFGEKVTSWIEDKVTSWMEEQLASRNSQSDGQTSESAKK